MASKFYTLSLRAGSVGPFTTRSEATDALTALLEAGHAGLDSSDIEEHQEEIDSAAAVTLLADQRNSLIDFCG